MDFAKAFGKVSNSLLIHTLESYGIGDAINRWIKKCLLGMKQTVMLEGHRSRPVDVDSGVTQGSVLGPSPRIPPSDFL